jgi:hypothetical protein
VEGVSLDLDHPAFSVFGKNAAACRTLSTREKRFFSGLEVHPGAKVRLPIPMIFRKVRRFMPNTNPSLQSVLLPDGSGIESLQGSGKDERQSHC